MDSSEYLVHRVNLMARRLQELSKETQVLARELAEALMKENENAADPE